jgi:Fic family protein
MGWNWQHKNWPNFTYDKSALIALEYKFSQNQGKVFGALKHIREDSREDLLVDILSNEALKTSEIEGEFLNRESVQSSIKRNLGLSVEQRKVSPAEFGISEMMVDLYKNYKDELSHDQLFDWHKMICNGRRDLQEIGFYRSHNEPMQIVSGRIDRQTIHFEAPLSADLFEEMEQFITWFHSVHSEKNELDLMPLVKAGIAHLYFESIHPFEDGNGRIGRAIAEKSIALSTNQPTLISLSHIIEANKKSYYKSLETHNRTLEITDWLVYFGQTILDAQEDTLKRIDFIIEKAKFFNRFSLQLNERQLSVVLRLFEEGPLGFKGGLSANNYQKIAKTSAATATRDLSDLVEKQVLLKKGMLKGTRYELNLKLK